MNSDGKNQSRGNYRLRHGSFVAESLWANSDSNQRHELLVRDVAGQVGPAAVVSHFSAAVLHGLNIPAEVELATVSLSWPGANGRGGSRNIRPHRARIETEDIVVIDDIRVTSAARTIYDLARSVDQLISVSVADAALRDSVCTKEDFESLLVRTAGLPGSAIASQVMTFASAEGADDLRSQGRVVFARLGVETPSLATTLQHSVLGDVGPIDFEFSRFRTAVTMTDDHAIDRLRDIGWQICRLDRAALSSPKLVLRDLSAAFAAAGHVRWCRRPPVLIGSPQPIWSSDYLKDAAWHQLRDVDGRIGNSR